MSLTVTPRPRKFPVVASARKVMATAFWDSEGTILTDYLEHGRTITGTYYADLIRKSRSTEREETRKVATRCAVSSPAHTSSQALAGTRIAGFKLLRHPWYLAD